MDKDTPHMDKDETRVCRTCPERGQQPVGNFYLYKEKLRADGYSRCARYDTQCKACTARHRQGRLAQRRATDAARRRGDVISRAERKRAADRAFIEDVTYLLGCDTPHEEIAKRMGIGLPSLRARMRALGHPLPRSREAELPLGRKECEELSARMGRWLWHRFRGQGLTVQQAAARINCDEGLVRRASREAGCELRVGSLLGLD